MKKYIVFLVIALTVLGLGGCAAINDLFSPVTNVGSITWSDDAQAHKGKDYLRFSFTLPASGTTYDCWGTDVYTDDSSIGTAAVHAGKITFAAGGTVTIRILPGRSSYTGSTANGVTSLAYDDWDGSFEFID